MVNDARSAIDRAMSEKQWQAQVVALARYNGWLCYHTWNSQHSERGYPDLTLIRHNRLVVAELKTERGTVTDVQCLWLEAFRACGIPAYVWRPRDWLDIVAILQRS